MQPARIACARELMVGEEGSVNCVSCGAERMPCPLCEGWLETKGECGEFVGCVNWPGRDYTVRR